MKENKNTKEMKQQNDFESYLVIFFTFYLYVK